MWRLPARSGGLQRLVGSGAAWPCQRPAAVHLAVHSKHPTSSIKSSFGRRSTSRGIANSTIVAMARPWRPDINDVDRLSKGDGARKRGTGNFNIPHRLSQEERPVYEAAKKKGFLAVKGTGYRRTRKGHPLCNSFRQWCDAKAQAAIVIEQDAAGDYVVVDLATLRLLDTSQVAQAMREAAAQLGARELSYDERPPDAVPFDVIPYKLEPREGAISAVPGNEAEAGVAASVPAASAADVAAAEAAVQEQSELVRALKAQGHSNQSPEVQRQVQELLQHKSHLEKLQQHVGSTGRGGSHHESCSSRGAASEDAAAARDSGTSDTGSSPQSITEALELAGNGSEGDGAEAASEGAIGGNQRRQVLDDDHPLAKFAIWQIPVQPLFFEAERSAAKELAKRLVEVCAAAAGTAVAKR